MNDRDALIDRAGALYEFISDQLNQEEAAWAVLQRFGADEGQDDPDEGFFEPMSDTDIRRASDMLESKFLGRAINVQLREKEVEFIINALSQLSTTSGVEAKMIELITNKLNK